MIEIDALSHTVEIILVFTLSESSITHQYPHKVIRVINCFSLKYVSKSDVFFTPQGNLDISDFIKFIAVSFDLIYGFIPFLMLGNCNALPPQYMIKNKLQEDSISRMTHFFVLG